MILTFLLTRNGDRTTYLLMGWFFCQLRCETSFLGGRLHRRTTDTGQK